LLKQLEEKELNGLLRRVTTLKQQSEVYGRCTCEVGRRRFADTTDCKLSWARVFGSARLKELAPEVQESVEAKRAAVRECYLCVRPARPFHCRGARAHRGRGAAVVARRREQGAPDQAAQLCNAGARVFRRRQAKSKGVPLAPALEAEVAAGR